MHSQYKNIRLLTFDELKEFILNIGERSFRANQIWNNIWVNNINDFNNFTNIPIFLRQKLSENFTNTTIKIDSQYLSKDKTSKFIFSLFDNSSIEGVLIPSKNRTTACISTQAGCPLKCRFCATGQLGFQRNLDFTEIYDQVILINNYSKEIFNKKLSNIVIMGMGEPFLNFDEVIKSISYLTNEKYFGMSPKRITLSTSGIIDKIYKFSDLKIGINLAISLHSAAQKIREQIMPIAQNNNINDLIKALEYYYKTNNERVTIEYLLLNNVNDSLKDAKELANFCKHFPVKINIIDYNNIAEANFEKSNENKKNSFVEYLEKLNILVNVRKSRGDEISAACGQLANKKI